MRDHFDELFVALQRLLPHHLLSRLAGRLSDCRNPLVRDCLIGLARKRFNIDLSEAGRQDARDYVSFNDFFTRELKLDVRPIDGNPNNLIFPADGAVSQCGPIVDDQIFQAKGHNFSLSQLLAAPPETVNHFKNGSFATIYLSPSDYHRVHMPIDGTLRSVEYVPGRLFSVNDTTTQHIPGLFARNERLICQFDTAAGRMAYIMVGAMLVAGIDTVWHGAMTPGVRRYLPVPEAACLGKGEELGRFRFGSTVIVLFEQDAITWQPLVAGDSTRMGQTMARLATSL